MSTVFSEDLSAIHPPLLLTSDSVTALIAMAFHNASASSFRDYMQQKNEKLYEQFEEQQHAAGGDGEGIFKCVCIFVNGFTRPSHLVSAGTSSPCATSDIRNGSIQGSFPAGA